MATAELIPAPPAGFIFNTTDEDLRRNTGTLPTWATPEIAERFAQVHGDQDVTPNPMDLEVTQSWIRVIRRRDGAAVLTATAPRSSNTRKVYRAFGWDGITNDERTWAVWMVRQAGFEVEDL